MNCSYLSDPVLQLEVYCDFFFWDCTRVLFGLREEDVGQGVRSVMMFGCVHRLTPPILVLSVLCASVWNCFTTVSTICQCRLLVRRPRVFDQRAFSAAGPSVWNSLPDSLSDTDICRDSFKRLLKAHAYKLQRTKASCILDDEALHNSTFWFLPYLLPY